jgi:sugar phosphate isomerase/epimerase
MSISDRLGCSTISFRHLALPAALDVIDELGFGVELWVESLHILRLSHTLDRAHQLTDRLAGSEVGVVMDFSHVVAPTPTRWSS